ncbi:MAG: DUF3796 domain-containing protein [Clostridiaceae bacterium]|nr:DUF3796 domain-containing protein [Clostridiaceae bacterium]
MKKKNLKYCGAFSIFGFLGFLYFINQNVSCLFFFSFFSFFSYFILGKLLEDTPDERYIENSNKAKVKTAMIPMTALFIIGWGSSMLFFTKEFVVVVSALGWSLTLIVYAILFAYYEKH